MENIYSKATNTIAKACSSRTDHPVHPAEKTSKKDVYAKNYTNKKPCKIKQCGRTLAD